MPYYFYIRLSILSLFVLSSYSTSAQRIISPALSYTQTSINPALVNRIRFLPFLHVSSSNQMVNFSSDNKFVQNNLEVQSNYFAPHNFLFGLRYQQVLHNDYRHVRVGFNTTESFELSRSLNLNLGLNLDYNSLMYNDSLGLDPFRESSHLTGFGDRIHDQYLSGGFGFVLRYRYRYSIGAAINDVNTRFACENCNSKSSAPMQYSVYAKIAIIQNSFTFKYRDRLSLDFNYFNRVDATEFIGLEQSAQQQLLIGAVYVWRTGFIHAHSRTMKNRVEYHFRDKAPDGVSVQMELPWFRGFHKTTQGFRKTRFSTLNFMIGYQLALVGNRNLDRIEFSALFDISTLERKIYKRPLPGNSL